VHGGAGLRGDSLETWFDGIEHVSSSTPAAE
jgi:hypothetical protein